MISTFSLYLFSTRVSSDNRIKYKLKPQINTRFIRSFFIMYTTITINGINY